MSYCRWSSDNFKCDIYAYHSCYDVYTIHVASNRIVEELPKVDYKLLLSKHPEDYKEYMLQAKARDSFMQSVTRKPIGLPFDGESYDCETLQEFYYKMIELRNVGYSFPDYVLDEIKEEMAEAKHIQ
jgi:hypothetical protein